MRAALRIVDSLSIETITTLGGGYSVIVYLQMIETNEDKSKFEEIYQEYRNLKA